MACLYPLPVADMYIVVLGSFTEFYGLQNILEDEIALFKGVENNEIYSTTYIAYVLVKGKSFAASIQHCICSRAEITTEELDTTMQRTSRVQWS